MLTKPLDQLALGRDKELLKISADLRQPAWRVMDKLIELVVPGAAAVRVRHAGDCVRHVGCRAVAIDMTFCKHLRKTPSFQLESVPVCPEPVLVNDFVKCQNRSKKRFSRTCIWWFVPSFSSIWACTSALCSGGMSCPAPISQLSVFSCVCVQEPVLANGRVLHREKWGRFRTARGELVRGHGDHLESKVLVLERCACDRHPSC